MEEQLREHLLEGEQLLWTGRPESFDTLDKTNKTPMIAGIIIKILITVGFLALYIPSAQESGKVLPGLIVIVLLFAAFALINPFLVVRKLRKKTIYGLTDQRILRAGEYDQAIPYERIKSAVLRTDKDGHTSLLCGPRAVNLKPWKWRGEAEASFINNPDDPEAARVIFYAIPMNPQVSGILNRYLPLRKS